MGKHDLLNPDRLFPIEKESRQLARELYDSIKDKPIISPHGHCDPAWFAENKPFANPASLFIIPDHYLLRMFYSQGFSLDQFGVKGKHPEDTETDPRKIWQLFCDNYYLFQATPSRIWLDHAIYEIFNVDKPINGQNANYIYDHIADCLAQPEFLPRALFERFNIEVLATTESPLDNLHHHQTLKESDWSGRVITTFRPDPVVDPEFDGFRENIKRLGEITGFDTFLYKSYIDAIKSRRELFKEFGATATDHGHRSARTLNLTQREAVKLYQKVINNIHDPIDADNFRAHMLTEMAKMSLDDGLVMQIHPGSFRNHNPWLHEEYGRDVGADIPLPTNYVEALKPLLDIVGNNKHLSIILFTLDETSYARELAPLAGVYPCLKLGPAWWFHDSVEGMRRYRRQVIETAGFYNTAGFNDDTRAFVSIPARHDMSRRIDCGFLSELVMEHRISKEEAFAIALQLSGPLAKACYKL